MRGTELYVVDKQNNPTGYKITTYGEQAGRLGTIYDRVKNGKVIIENQSGLNFTRA